MIRVWYEQEGRLHRLSVSGHAGYAPRGKDIVCAGVSALVLGLWAWLEQVPEAVDALDSREGADGEFYLEVQGGKSVRTAFHVALAGLEEISKQWPGFVEVEKG